MYDVKKECDWKDFHGKPGDVLKTLTAGGKPLPDEVIEHLVKAGALVKTEAQPTPAPTDE